MTLIRYVRIVEELSRNLDSSFCFDFNVQMLARWPDRVNANTAHLQLANVLESCRCRDTDARMHHAIYLPVGHTMPAQDAAAFARFLVCLLLRRQEPFASAVP